MKTPPRVWAGVLLISACLLALPFALAYAGTAWVRIANFAILYVLLADQRASKEASKAEA